MSSLERMTACENVCREFFLLPPVTEVLQHLAVIAGVVLAWRQLISWRSQRLAAKRADLGEDLLAAIYELEIKISYICSTIGFIPASDEPDDGTFDFVRRLKEIAELNDEFINLRRLKFRQRFLFENSDIERNIDEFFEVRTKLIVALKSHIWYLRNRPSDPPPSYAQSEKERMAVILEVFDGEQSDKVADSIKSAKTSIERAMLPYIRLGIVS